jgi:hypothetical protein
MSERTSQKNRRLNWRRPPNGLIGVVCQKGSLGLGLNLALSLVDLSEDGACLLVKEALNLGEEVCLNLEAPGNRRPVRCLGQVVWVQPRSEGVYSVGIRFEKRVAYADLLHLTREAR